MIDVPAVEWLSEDVLRERIGGLLAWAAERGWSRAEFEDRALDYTLSLEEMARWDELTQYEWLLDGTHAPCCRSCRALADEA